MDKHLASRLAKEPDNFIEFNRRVVQLKRLASGIRNQEAALQRFLSAEQQQVLQDAVVIFEYMRVHLIKAATIKSMKL